MFKLLFLFCFLTLLKFLIQKLINIQLDGILLLIENIFNSKYFECTVHTFLANWSPKYKTLFETYPLSTSPLPAEGDVASVIQTNCWEFTLSGIHSESLQEHILWAEKPHTHSFHVQFNTNPLIFKMKKYVEHLRAVFKTQIAFAQWHSLVRTWVTR